MNGIFKQLLNVKGTVVEDARIAERTGGRVLTVENGVIR